MSCFFGIYDAQFIDMNALNTLVERWLCQSGYKKKNSLLDSHFSCPVKKKFGFDAAGQLEKLAFDTFYDHTRTLFFLDENSSTYADSLFELQPHMLEYFQRELDAYFFRTRVLARPMMIPLDESWFFQWLQRFHATPSGDQAIFVTNYSALERERQRKSKRLCVLQQREQIVEQPKKRKLQAICDETPALLPLSKPKKTNFNCVQWKHLQVQARKQLHEAVLFYRFSHVRLIAAEWQKESEHERRLDIDAVEWAFRRICKQILPLAAEKEIAMRRNSLQMIDTLFECFASMQLCKKTCMKKHIIDICRNLDHRKDIVEHMMQFKCSCI